MPSPKFRLFGIDRRYIRHYLGGSDDAKEACAKAQEILREDTSLRRIVVSAEGIFSVLRVIEREAV
jgi:hypothetical protein